ncbi:hypothetical protein ON010_g7582 [Phytophthora cinnamomi]|nr:hypothetical protein ON010_g7582 [Phytophthora cinnamomi]
MSSPSQFHVVHTCFLFSATLVPAQQSINQSVGLLEQLCSHDGQGGRHGAGVPRRDDLRRQGAEGGQRPGRAGGSGRGRPGLGQHAVLPALPGLGQEVGRVGAPRPRAGGHARQPRAAAQGQGGPGHGQEGEAPGQEEEDQLGRRGRAQRAQVAVQAPQAQRRERLRGVPRPCRGRRRGRSQAGEHPDALLAQEAARGGLEERDAGAAQARAAAPQAQRGPDRQDVPRVQEEQGARRRGRRGEGVQEHRGHHAGCAVLLRPRAQLHPALPHGAQAVPGAPAEARGGRAALADLRRRTPHQALREITGAAGRFQHRPARAAPDPGATQRLPQVHPEELGGLVRHGVRGRVRQNFQQLRYVSDALDLEDAALRRHELAGVGSGRGDAVRGLPAALAARGLGACRGARVLLPDVAAHVPVAPEELLDAGGLARPAGRRANVLHAACGRSGVSWCPRGRQPVRRIRGAREAVPTPARPAAASPDGGPLRAVLGGAGGRGGLHPHAEAARGAHLRALQRRHRSQCSRCSVLAGGEPRHDPAGSAGLPQREAPRAQGAVPAAQRAGVLQQDPDAQGQRQTGAIKGFVGGRRGRVKKK